MAKINGLYIFVIDESKTFGVDATEHPVETGVDITDHVKRKAVEMSITGEIVGDDAASTMSRLKQMHQNGTLCKYVGRTTLSNCIITDFSTSHPHTIWGGCEFSMTLKEIRTASTSYKKVTGNATSAPKKTGTQQVKKESKVEYVYHTVKKGDAVWALVAASNAPYKKYGFSCDDVMKLNPGAFSRKNDFRTLQIGKKIIVGKR